jgi:hypothetical protein
MTAMNDRIHELLHRSLQEVFGEGDAARRRAAIDELYTEDCMLDVPPGTFIGREAVDSLLAISARPTRTSSIRRTANLRPSTMRVVWLGVPARAAKRPTTGMDVIIVRGLKIAALYVFLDSIPS